MAAPVPQRQMSAISQRSHHHPTYRQHSSSVSSSRHSYRSASIKASRHRDRSVNDSRRPAIRHSSTLSKRQDNANGQEQIAALKTALSKVGRQRSHKFSKSASENSLGNKSTPSPSLTALTTTTFLPVADAAVEVNGTTPLRSGWAQQKGHHIFSRTRRRYLVVRQMCLEVYDTAEAFELGHPRSCVLLIGASLACSKTKLTLRVSGKTRSFVFETNEDARAWATELERIIAKITPSRHFTRIGDASM